ncbi:MULTISPECIES: GNAT family N-acetyltransferase [unclassified Enterococcus]|jgi:ribosomal protein S18 acetylase RimI-like enzyme|uniref:GNAT family N-acetyltransferase n=1 Tax=unclassified Enterococcus TaxID=2608891 RepID=UPI003D28CE32
MDILKLERTDSTTRKEVSRIFVDSFYQWLKFFSKDKEKLSAAFEHIFNEQLFYVAQIDGKTAGMAACSYKGVQTVQLQKEAFIKHLGFIRGRYAYSMLHKQFVTKEYPFTVAPSMGLIEFVAVSSDFRGQGVASALIETIMDREPFASYTLEVADTNEPAVRLYQKLGFKEFKRVKEKHRKLTGLNYYIYMEKIKNRKS